MKKKEFMKKKEIDNNIEEISIELKPIIYIIKVFMIVTVIIIIYKLFY
jgi:hypothetical protein